MPGRRAGEPQPRSGADADDVVFVMQGVPGKLGFTEEERRWIVGVGYSKPLKVLEMSACARIMVIKSPLKEQTSWSAARMVLLERRASENKLNYCSCLSQDYLVPRLISLLFGANQLVEPRCESERRFADLEFHDRNPPNRVSVRREIGRVVHPLVHVVTGPPIGLTRPARSTFHSVRGIGTCEPHVRRFVEKVFTDARHETREEGGEGVVGEGLADSGGCVGYEAVPDLNLH